MCADGSSSASGTGGGELHRGGREDRHADLVVPATRAEDTGHAPCAALFHLEKHRERVSDQNLKYTKIHLQDSGIIQNTLL